MPRAVRAGVAYIGGGEVDAEVAPLMASAGTRRGGEVVSERVLGRAWSQAHLMELLSALDG